MLTDVQVSVLCDIAKSVVVAKAKQDEVDQLVKDGYVARDGNTLQLTHKAETALADRGVGLHES